MRKKENKEPVNSANCSRAKGNAIRQKNNTPFPPRCQQSAEAHRLPATTS